MGAMTPVHLCSRSKGIKPYPGSSLGRLDEGLDSVARNNCPGFFAELAAKCQNLPLRTLSLHGLLLEPSADWCNSGVCKLGDASLGRLPGDVKKNWGRGGGGGGDLLQYQANSSVSLSC